MTVDSKTQNNSTLLAPSVLGRWRFGHLSAADLLPQLQQYLSAQDNSEHWQLTWLNNDGHPIIGLLPKVSWSVYPLPKLIDTNTPDVPPTYRVIKYCRMNQQLTQKDMGYSNWQNELITYSNQYCSTKPFNEPILCSTFNQNYSTQIPAQETECPSYQHGLIGFIGYDIASTALSPHAQDSPDNEACYHNIAGSENTTIDGGTQPAAVIGHYDIYLSSHIHKDGHLEWTLQNADKKDKQQAAITELIGYLDHLNSLINSKENTQQSLCSVILNAKWQKSDYERAFAATQHYLLQGDCYQINLTQAWLGELGQSYQDGQSSNKNPTNILDYLPVLQRHTLAPFAGYLGFQSFGTQAFQPQASHGETKSETIFNIDESENQASSAALTFELLSCSPELFFTFIKDHETGKHHICTKPIKGTMPRGSTVEQDSSLKQQLSDSAKDRSENVMIVDLLRNDLGKYAKTGSVKVPQLFAIESFSNVHHMVSTITAELKPDVHPLAVLFGSLPAGSITGTPKKRAVEIIKALEGSPRGAYCGTMGYMNFDGSGQWNVLIRTLQAHHDAQGKKQVSLWAGGGITVASDCAAEYQECMDKVGHLLDILHHPNR